MANNSNKKYVADNEKLIAEWNWDKNNELGLNPDELTCGSGKKAWWICDKGHEWEVTVNHRDSGYGCPYCSGRYAIIGMNDLATVNPELAKQWHPTKNGDLTPQDVTSCSNKKVWWICDKGHEWEAIIANRNIDGNGCPYCSNQKILIGYNDLETINPELAKQWHPTKNGDLTAQDVAAGSGKKVWWMCEKGHEWEASISSRHCNGNGCPYCNKEKSTSFAEQAIYFYCNKVTDAINRYKELGKEIDVYLPEYNIGIEYNGGYWHKDKELQDAEKIKYFADKGIRIITIKESDRNYIDGDIIEHIYSSTNKTSINFVIKSIFHLIGIESKEVDVNRDTNKILEEYIDTIKENSIAVKCKKALAEWDYKKNGRLLPSMVSYGSGKRAWWKCGKCGHEWQSVIRDYARGRGCPECRKKSIGKRFSKQIRCIETGIVYESMAMVEKEMGIGHSHISMCCNGKQDTAGGYHWEFVDANDINKKEISNETRRKISEANKGRANKQVRCIETNKVYDSMTYAEKETGVSRNCISNACRGATKTAGGYHWEFVDNNKERN